MNDIAYQKLLFLYEVTRELTANLEIPELLTRLLDMAINYSNAIRGSIIITNEKGSPIHAVVYYDKKVNIEDPKRMGNFLDEGLAGWVYQKREAALISNTDEDERWVNNPDFPESSMSSISLPLMMGNEILGVMTITHPQQNAFTEEHLDLMQALTGQASVAVMNARLFEESEKRAQLFRDLFEDSLTPVFITDWEGRVIRANRQAEKITGFSQHKLAAMNIGDFHEISEKLGVDLSAVIEGNPVMYQSSLTDSNKNVYHVEVAVRRVLISGKEQIQWVMLDVTEQKKTEILKEDLLQMIIHDIRSPIANLVSSMGLMQSFPEISENEILMSIVEIADRSTGRVQRLADSLLDMARMEAGKQIGLFEDILMKELVDDVIKLLEPIIAKYDQSVELDIQDEELRVFIDEEMIKRVVINLIENAMKFSPQDSVIRVGFEKVEGDARIWVEDDGPGIDAEMREVIFDKFIQGDKKTNKGRKGMGIGLSYVKLAVENHGGKVWVESDGEKGSKFIFSIPLSYP
jgi:PAS domain S-box-containing protein